MRGRRGFLIGEANGCSSFLFSDLQPNPRIDCRGECGYRTPINKTGWIELTLFRLSFLRQPSDRLLLMNSLLKAARTSLSPRTGSSRLLCQAHRIQLPPSSHRQLLLPLPTSPRQLLATSHLPLVGSFPPSQWVRNHAASSSSLELESGWRIESVKLEREGEGEGAGEKFRK